LATVVTLATGASKHRIEDRWTNPDIERHEYRKLLVIAITDDREVRAVFEDRFVSHLRGKSIEAVTSRSLAPDLASIDEAQRTEIIKTVEEQGIDGAISVRAVPLKGQGGKDWTEDWSRQVRGDGTLRQLIEESLPISTEKSKKYGIEAALWDAKSGHRIWGGRTNPYTRDQLKKGAADLTQFIMYALEIEDLIKGVNPYPEDASDLEFQQKP
jgi:hypothetical protein